MTSNPDRVAEGVIRVAILRIAGEFPFHACVMEKFRLVNSPSIETMGVTATDRGVTLLYNRDFVVSLPADMLGGVLLHEIHHVVLGHLGLRPADFPDEWAFVVACETSVNEFVRLPLPSGVIRLEQFSNLPPMESTLQRYRRLTAVAQSGRFEIAGPSGLACPPGGEPGESARVIDVHAVWGSGGADPNSVREVISTLLNEAAAEAGGIPEELQNAVKSIGRGTAGQIYILAGGAEGRRHGSDRCRGSTEGRRRAGDRSHGARSGSGCGDAVGRNLPEFIHSFPESDTPQSRSAD